MVIHFDAFRIQGPSSVILQAAAGISNLDSEPGRLQQTGDACSEGVKAVTGRRTEESMNAMKVVKDLEKFTGQVDIKVPEKMRAKDGRCHGVAGSVPPADIVLQIADAVSRIETDAPQMVCKQCSGPTAYAQWLQQARQQ